MLYNLAEGIRFLALLLHPYMPESSGKVLEALAEGNRELDAFGAAARRPDGSSGSRRCSRSSTRFRAHEVRGPHLPRDGPVRLLLGRGRLRHLPDAADRDLRQRRPVRGRAASAPTAPPAIFFALFGGIIGLFVAGGHLLDARQAARAARPPQNAGVIVWFWTGLFWSLAVGCFLGVWGPEANPGPGGKEGGLIVGFMGLIMGAGGFLGVTLGKENRASRFR